MFLLRGQVRGVARVLIIVLRYSLARDRTIDPVRRWVAHRRKLRAVDRGGRDGGRIRVLGLQSSEDAVAGQGTAGASSTPQAEQHRGRRPVTPRDSDGGRGWRPTRPGPMALRGAGPERASRPELARDAHRGRQPRRQSSSASSASRAPSQFEDARRARAAGGIRDGGIEHGRSPSTLAKLSDACG